MNSTDSAFSAEQLLSTLDRLPSPPRYWVGFSGGADSTALLQALHECQPRLQAPIEAIHFHHGLQSEADGWQDHCRSFCQERDIPFRSEKLEVGAQGGGGPEERARNSRYRAIARLLGNGEMYLTAHHAEDQAETLFLNLMRGSGIEGLAGIPEIRALEHGWVARPLLDRFRFELEAFLNDRGIAWLTDPSNEDTSFDRNYLRLELFPILENRWPGLVRRLSRTARNARITTSAMAIFIENQSGDLIQDKLKMPLHKLLELDPEMQTLIVRQWLRRHEVPMLPEIRLREFLDQLHSAIEPTQTEVQWGDWIIKRYKHDLWLHRRKPMMGCPELAWQQGMELDLGQDLGRLVLRGPAREPPDGWQVRPRKPGDRIRPLEDGPSQKIKQFFQLTSIPPWLRASIPVLDWDGEAVALGDWVLGHRLREWLLENDLDYQWQPDDSVLARLHAECQL